MSDVLSTEDRALWFKIAKQAEMRWMSVEDAEITVPARSVALASRELNASEAQVEQLRGERDGWQATAEVLQDSEAMADLFESERERADAAEAAARAGGCAADALREIAKMAGPGESGTGAAGWILTLQAPRIARDALARFDRAVSGQTAEKEEA